MEAGEGTDFRKWDDLTPDVIGLIFGKLPLEDKLTAVPSVCKAWAATMKGPYCWQEIDILEWSSICRPDQLNRLLRLLLRRSAGSLRTLHVSRIDDHLLSFIAQHARFLEILTLSRSKISSAMIEKVAEKFAALKSLDLSHTDIDGCGIQAIGKNCALESALIFFRSTPPFLSEKGPSSIEITHAIAQTMPKLKLLKLDGWIDVDTDSILGILSGCPELESLDISRCRRFKFDHKFFKNKFPKVQFVVDNESGQTCGFFESWDVDGLPPLTMKSFEDWLRAQFGRQC